MHFTYTLPKGDLQQGDLLKRTPDLDDVLREVHPHYHQNQDYKYLIVLTQSCDLVTREGVCKSRYISLAAVRSFDTLFQRELAQYQRSEREIRLNYCSAERRILIKQFLERLFNNNEPGYFYLHKDLEFGISEPIVAFLVLCIAVKSSLHYGTCLAARIAQLKEPFQNKLGWLVGNMYSRVATADWVPEAGVTADEFDGMIDEILESRCAWVDERFMERISKEEKRRQKTKGADYRIETQEELKQLVDQLGNEHEARKDEVVDRAVAVLRDMGIQIEAYKLRRRLKNDPLFSRNIK